MPYLKVPALMQVGDMKQYLQGRMKLPESYYHRLEILTIYDDKEVILDECLTMSDILMSFWDNQSELIVYYRIVDEST